MSAIAISNSASAALPAVNIHPHSHKKGAHVGSADDSRSDTATLIPSNTVRNLFGSLLQTLGQVIGVQIGAPNASTTSSPAVTASAAVPASGAAPDAGTSSASTPSAGRLLQNYLNNVSQHAQSNDLRRPTLAGSTISVNV